MDLGLRVVRGPHWIWKNQDGGDGCVGTVVEFGKPGHRLDRFVVVQWDSGFRTDYRIGYQGSFDLRLLDSAPTGIKHQGVGCDTCDKPRGIQGMRWKCAECYDFDLCHECYMADKHDLNHAFLRFTNPDNGIGVKVTKRCSAVKIPAWGIFPGATVLRGPDWNWGNQDGGELQPGKVKDIQDCDSESGRSLAKVFWVSTGLKNTYRLGHNGKVDIKCKEASSGGFYYRDHLPVLADTVDMSPSKDTQSLFKVGDQVKVTLREDVLKTKQDGHGGWNPRMAKYIGRVGIVDCITGEGDVGVQYDSCRKRWTFHPDSLSKLQQIAVGDYVKIISDVQKVKNLQRGHGGWVDNMRRTLGKTGKIVKVYADGDVRVSLLGAKWTFNAKCVSYVSCGSEDGHQHIDPMVSLMAEFLGIK